MNSSPGSCGEKDLEFTFSDIFKPALGQEYGSAPLACNLDGKHTFLQQCENGQSSVTVFLNKDLVVQEESDNDINTIDCHSFESRKPCDRNRPDCKWARLSKNTRPACYFSEELQHRRRRLALKNAKVKQKQFLVKI